jgi:PIN domain nuclease of toxin-antitoxin system
MVRARCASEMKLLLDTHVFPWWNEASPRLSRRARHLLSDHENSLYLSVASAWEIALIAQGQVERLPIVTHDPQVRKYAVETIW